MPEEGTEIAGLPSVLGGGPPAPGAPPAGGPSAMPLGDEPDDAPSEGVMDLAELSGMCGDIYADVFGVAGQLYVGVPVELDETRVARRGKQIAVVLRKLGWADDEIVCYVGLTAGVASDFAVLHRMKTEREEEQKRAAAAAGGTPEGAKA